MSTIKQFNRTAIKKNHPLLSSIKSIIETAFYGNNVVPISLVSDAYHLARKSPSVIVTDLPVEGALALDLPEDAKILVHNDGAIVGRTAAARRVIGQPGVDEKKYSALLREAIFEGTKKHFYRGDVVVGLNENFMVAAHLLVPIGYEANFYAYLLNFQPFNATYQQRYQQSQPYNENDLYVYCDPDWRHPDYPIGLTLFDPTRNVAAILGLRYFGELKKATLTLAWATAHRNGYLACHGGVKQFQLANKTYTMATYGLSGSGKSTITLASHGQKYHVTVLHDDAFIIDQETGATTALEPTYFDKTQDYPMDSEQVKYLLTCQNVGVTLDEHHQKVLVTEDIRNNNGRAMKSRFATPNRVDHLTQSLDAVYWIMKDESLPPVIRIDDPMLAAVFGATLATQRSSAENVADHVDLQALVIEPFANPFRCYPLAEDYLHFKQLFTKQKTTCYILNTGSFNGYNIPPNVTLEMIEKIIDETAVFIPFGPVKGLSYSPVPRYQPDFDSPVYRQQFITAMKRRLAFIQEMNTKNNGYDALPEETMVRIQQILLELTT